MDVKDTLENSSKHHTDWGFFALCKQGTGTNIPCVIQLQFSGQFTINAVF